MLSDADREAWRAARDSVDARIIDRVTALMEAGRGTRTAGQIRDELLQLLPELVQAAGDTNAELAALYYGLARELVEGDAPFFPVAEFSDRRAEVESSVGWALGPIFTAGGYSDAAFDEAIARVKKSMIDHARRGERETVLANMAKDPAGPTYRRVPRAGACPFCMMLASRGYAYRKNTVLKTFEGARYHSKCKCTSEPRFPGEPIPAFVQHLEAEWQRVTEGLHGDDALEAFYRHVYDGGLGDRPVPVRTYDGKYRRVDGTVTEYSSADISRATKPRFVKHIDKIEKPGKPKAHGGHTAKWEGAWIQEALAGHLRNYQTLFSPAVDYDRYHRDALAAINAPDSVEGDGAMFDLYRKVVGDYEIEVVVGLATDGGRWIISSYPISGAGRVVWSDGETEDLPPLGTRIKEYAIEREQRRARERGH